MIPKKVMAAALTLGVGLCVAGGPARARNRHHHHEIMTWAPTPYVRPRPPSRFYPDDIEGGVSGNLPFNNQLRKLSDPLNANGAGG